MLDDRSCPCLFLGLCLAAAISAPAAAEEVVADGSAKAPQVMLKPGPEYAGRLRQFQGIPGLERAANGRLWAVWYGGGKGEDRHNYLMLATSSDDGNTWSDVVMVIDPDKDGPCLRLSIPALWRDPTDRLWLFWAQRDRGVHLWAMVADNGGDEMPAWSPPRLICEGIMMCKPTTTSKGQWLLPVALWRREGSAAVVSSEDQGKTWSMIGRANIPNEKDRNCDEPMIVQRTDGSLWMLVRTAYGIGESVSADFGRTWTDVAPLAIRHATTRFFLRRLQSGRLAPGETRPDRRADGSIAVDRLSVPRRRPLVERRADDRRSHRRFLPRRRTEPGREDFSHLRLLPPRRQADLAGRVHRGGCGGGTLRERSSPPASPGQPGDGPPDRAMIDSGESSILVGGVEHGLDVLHGHILLDVVHLSEDEASRAPGEHLDVFPHVLADLLRRGQRQHLLGVAPAAPEHDLSAELLHQPLGLHVRGGDLHGV